MPRRRACHLRVEERLDALWFLTAADVFVDTQRQFTPVVMARLAASIGVQTVASQTTSAAEIVRNDYGQLVPAGDERALTDGISFCLMKGRLRAPVAAQSAMADMTQSMCELYASVLGQPRFKGALR
jgi:glycosyltransferase involved in cell wall biosynthesis